MANSIASTNDAVTALANVLQGANLGSGSDQGYRHLKPKKDLQKITASDAKTLMIELADFEVDLGELGVPIQSEAAYRQFRAVCQGKAREIVDLELVRGEGVQAARLAAVAVVAVAAMTTAPQRKIEAVPAAPATALWFVSGV